MRADKLRPGEWLLIAIAVISLALSIIYYPKLPRKQEGFFQDSPPGSFYYGGYPNKLLPTFALTALILASAGTYILIPRFRSRCPDNRYRFYDHLLIFLCAFWLWGQFLAIYEWHGGRIGYNGTKLFCLSAMAYLFFSLGNAFAHGRPDWFVSIRNRWTIGDSRVWDATHHKIGKSLKAAAVFMAIQALTPMPYAFYPAALALLLAEFYIFVYPFYLHRKLKKADSKAGPDEKHAENAPTDSPQPDRSQT